MDFSYVFANGSTERLLAVDGHPLTSVDVRGTDRGLPRVISVESWDDAHLLSSEPIAELFHTFAEITFSGIWLGSDLDVLTSTTYDEDGFWLNIGVDMKVRSWRRPTRLSNCLTRYIRSRARGPFRYTL